jgi:hypothetical protein
VKQIDSKDWGTEKKRTCRRQTMRGNKRHINAFLVTFMRFVSLLLTAEFAFLAFLAAGVVIGQIIHNNKVVPCLVTLKRKPAAL